MLRCPALVLSLAAAGAARAPAQDLASRLPDSTVAFAEVARGGEFVEALHRWVDRLPGLPARARIGMTFLDAAARGISDARTAVDLAASVAPAGVCVGLVVDARGPAVVALVDGAGPRLDDLVARAGGRIAFARAEGDIGMLAPDAERLEALRAALAGRGRQLGDRGRTTVVGRDAAADGNSIRFFVDLARARVLGPDRRSLWDRVQPDARVLAAPWAALLDAAGRVDGVLTLLDRSVEVAVGLDAEGAADPRARVLLADPASPRPAPPRTDATLARIELDRSLSGLLTHADEVLGEAGAARVRAGLTTLDTLVGGSFVEDLLPALGEPWTLLVEDVDPVPGPTVTLPAFALCAPVLDRGVAEERLHRLAGTLALAANAERMRKELPAFRLRRGDREEMSVLFAEPGVWRGPLPAPVELSWTPTVAVSDRWVVVATHREVAERLVMSTRPAQSEPAAVGDRIRVRPDLLATWIGANHDRLALGQVLDDGKTLVQAREDIADLAKVLGCFGRFAIELSPAGGRTEVRFELRRNDR